MNMLCTDRTKQHLYDTCSPPGSQARDINRKIHTVQKLCLLFALLTGQNEMLLLPPNTCITAINVHCLLNDIYIYIQQRINDLRVCIMDLKYTLRELNVNNELCKLVFKGPWCNTFMFKRVFLLLTKRTDFTAKGLYHLGSGKSPIVLVLNKSITTNFKQHWTFCQMSRVRLHYKYITLTESNMHDVVRRIKFQLISVLCQPTMTSRQ